MSQAMVTLLAMLAVLVIGIVVGLVLRGAVLIGDRRALDRLSSRLDAERRMAAATQATLTAMRRAARCGDERRSSGGQP